MMEREKFCNNCNAKLKHTDIFCHHCSQKYRSEKPSLWFILGEFFSSVFNLDSKVYRSFSGLFRPGKLTNAFIDGKLKSYNPPLRIFVLSSLFMVAGLSALSETDEEIKMSESYISKLHKGTNMEEIRELKPRIYQMFPDSSTNLIIDTIIYEMTNGEEIDNYISFIERDTADGGWSFSTSKSIPTIDIFKLSEDSLFKKHNVHGFFPQLLARQQIKNTKDENGFEKYFLSRITIIALIMMPIVALILKLLYYRREQFFVDHFVFSLHNHSFAFTTLGITSLAIYFFDLEDIVLIPAFTIISIYLFLSMKQVYKQSVIKTMLKFLLLNFSYLVVITFFLVFAALVSFLTF